MLPFFAAGDDLHISLMAEKVFSIGPFTVTNAILYGLVCAIFICVLMVYVARRMSLKPRKGITEIMEIVVEFVISLLQGPFGSREKAARFVPIFGVFFLFIVFNNLAGIIPLVGPGFFSMQDGEAIPLFRPFTADLNGTIALSVIAIIVVQILSIKEQGFVGHLRHYFTDKPFNPVNLFLGILEVFGELTRAISLSLRLFLNTAVGEILIIVFTSMILAGGRTPLAAIPIFLFEALVAFIQAYVFTVLVGTYLGMAIAHAHDDHGDHQPTDIPKQVETRGVHGG